MVKVRVKVHRPRVEELDMDYPFIGLESWCEYILEHCSHHLLGGFEIGKDAAQYTAMFHRFWERYKQLDPSHIAFSTFSDFGRVIPYCVHGDEGRGKAKSAILITSYQALISPHGEGATNLKGHSYTTRLLAYLMPSKNFASNDATIDCLSAHMVTDLQKVFTNGVTATWHCQQCTFYLAYIGLKGDWPYLRKVMNLESGFTSRRVCHLCTRADARRALIRFVHYCRAKRLTFSWLGSAGLLVCLRNGGGWVAMDA
ncbi:Uncharacterized protein SCF082_LOCUS12465 [Durusdinium trenchii]|uniref:Uncharacterized protein n=1 Tax=Durusdinium trenchii TaxID=1381693 RepID=A0ABP0JKI1_9DINO